MPFVYRVTDGNILIERLRIAIRLVARKHSLLRTAVFCDFKTDRVIRRLIEIDENESEPFAFAQRTIESKADLSTIMSDELSKATDLKMSGGYAFHIHVFTQDNRHNNLLQTGDFLVFNFHSSLFDRSSMKTFWQDLCVAYESDTAFPAHGHPRLGIFCK
jgi:hypothetical protein